MTDQCPFPASSPPSDFPLQSLGSRPLSLTAQVHHVTQPSANETPGNIRLFGKEKTLLLLQLLSVLNEDVMSRAVETI